MVFAPDGKPIGRIALPERCANLCFGGVKRNRLFMAASQSVYALYVNTQGALRVGERRPALASQGGCMPPKTVLVAGASGLVGYAAMKHFASDPACEVIAVSRRRPDETFGARFVAADLTDARSCSEVFGALGT